jgi:hypothetical protein
LDTERAILWDEIRDLYEDSTATLAEISAWALAERGWGPTLSAISNRASRYGWQPRQQRCLIFPVGMLRLHLRDHYANAVRAEGRLRRGLPLSPTETEKLSQASSMIEEGLALAYEPSRGFFCVHRPTDDLPDDEWLTWWRDYDGLPDSEPVTALKRLRGLGH